MAELFVRKFDKGLITRIEAESIARGGASDALNWHFLGDRVELRRGQVIMGTAVDGTGRVTGIRKVARFDGTEVLFHTRGRSAFYYDESTDAWVESGSSLFPSAVVDSSGNAEDISIQPYYSLAGAFAYLSSPNSSIYKIAASNPGSPIDLQSKTHRGHIRIKLARMALWNRKDSTGGQDSTGLYLSKIDRDELSDYTFVTAENIGTGNGSNKTFNNSSAALAFKSPNGGSRRTCMFFVCAAATTAPTNITAITKATNAKITSVAHGLAVGDATVIDDVVGMTQINGRIGIVTSVVDADNFTVNIDSNFFTAWSSGGNVGKAELFSDTRSGTLTSNNGGTGTINYASGMISVTFGTAPLNTEKVYAEYYWEDASFQLPSTSTYAITGVTAATAAVVTVGSHALAIGDEAYITGCVGMNQLNDNHYTVTAISGTTITLAVNSTSFTAWSSGGTIQKWLPDSNGGIANFAKSVPREAGDGAVFRQDDGGGAFQAIASIGGTEYCFHISKTWALTIGSDDTSATNLVYRDRVGIAYFRSMVETGDGIYFMDSQDVQNPAFRLLQPGLVSPEVIPKSVSSSLDLSPYRFEKCKVFEFGQYVCFTCRTQDETANNRLFMLHRVWKTWEVHNIRVSDSEIYNGELKAGDSATNNVYTLFSGLVDEESNIDNFLITGNDDLGVPDLKIVNQMVLRGWIGADQVIQAWLSADDELFTLAGTVSGTGKYVDLSQSKVIGSTTLGEDMIGGGDTSGGIVASPFATQFFIGTQRFSKIRLKITATQVGYASISEYGFVDIRGKGKALPVKYVQS